MADALGHGAGLGGIGFRQQDAELVAAVAAGDVDVAQAGADHAGHAADHFVARRVALLVVDRLERVDVQHQQRGRTSQALVAAQLAQCRFLPVDAADQAGERVDAVELGQLPVLLTHLARQREGEGGDADGVGREERQAQGDLPQARRRLEMKAVERQREQGGDELGGGGARQEAPAANADLVHRQHGNQQRAGQQVEMHQHHPDAGAGRIDHQVAPFRGQRIGAAARQVPGQVRPGKSVEAQGGPGQGAGAVAVEHAGDADEGQAHAEAAQPAHAVDEAQVFGGNAAAIARRRTHRAGRGGLFRRMGMKTGISSARHVRNRFDQQCHPALPPAPPWDDLHLQASLAYSAT